MFTHDVTFKLSDPLFEAAASLASKQGVTIGQVIRNALAAEIRRTTKAKGGPSSGRLSNSNANTFNRDAERSNNRIAR